MNTREKNLKIAVIGGGVSGITAAYLLQKNHQVTLYEKNDYIGGHTHTVVIPDGPDAGTPVDTGFIVLNRKTYPNLLRFLALHSVDIAPTEMSLSYHERDTRFTYATQNLNALFADRSNLIKPWYWKFLFEIRRFLLQTRTDYHAGRLTGLNLGEYLQKCSYSEDLTRRFILPWSAAIWSAADVKMREFPMEAFAQFYENHGLLSVEKEVPWFFVKGGSHTYVHAFLNRFNGTVIKDCPIQEIRRDDSVTVTTKEGSEEAFDKIVIATHADEALALLKDPRPLEKQLLGAWQYSQNQVYLHTDRRYMPDNRRAWASWNYLRTPGKVGSDPITVTYWMNRLQRLKTQRHYLVTLNPPQSMDENHVIKAISYTHPIYSFESFDSQKKLSKLNGENNTYFCGSYFGYGFHEDGVKSATEVGKHFGVTL